MEVKLPFDLSACYLLFVNSLQHLGSATNRRLRERLSFTQLQQDLSLLKLLLVLLEGFVNVFAVFRIDN
jgi:hypothetical protein